MPAVRLGEKLRYLGVSRVQDIRLGPLARGLVQKENYRVNARREIVPLQAVDGLGDGVFAQDVMNVGGNSGLQEQAGPGGCSRSGTS